MIFTPVPETVLYKLLTFSALYAGGTAYQSVRDSYSTPSSPPPAVHPGDAFGDILAFVWSLSPDRTVQVMADFMSGLIAAAKEDGAKPPALAAVLTYLPQALPNSMTPDEAAAVVAALQQQTPLVYGDPTL